MPGFIVERCFQSVLTLVLVSVVVFLLINISGDPAALLVPEEAGPETIAATRSRLGLDRPLYERYVFLMLNLWDAKVVKSFRYADPLFPLILQHLLHTLILATAAITISLILAFPLGTVAALKHGSVLDVGVRILAVLGQSMPSFWVAMILILIFAVRLRLFPVSGLGLPHAVLPTATLAVFQLGLLLRLVRSEVLEVLTQDYVRVARAKGLSEWQVVTRHILKNAALPVLTMTGLQLNNLILGAVVVEPIFAWPGLGYLMVNAVFWRDYPLVVAGAMLAGVLVAGINLVVDILYGVLDPRIRAA
jgi:peptide/nickel transport system permease protein